ncbi:MAG: A/G-specific adenine glycosylase [Pseudomonadota bacterium]
MDWFATHLLNWYEQHGRKDLPWQQDINPYRVWISEIMLQQTQVATVMGYYQRFMQRFADVQSLADADIDEVLHHWTGLGYYARARNLHKTARRVVAEFDGTFPTSQEALESLPGIGRSTAGAIRAIAMRQPATILDGNVKRVLTRFHAVAGYPGDTAVSKTLWTLAESHTPDRDTHKYTQAIMDLGATLCVRRKPGCDICPVMEQCEARARHEVERFPERKPKKDKPVRRAKMFVVSLDNNATFLEQKPMEGLWGGLWTPPERSEDTDAATLLAELGYTEADVARSHAAPEFRHTFTHFHLDIAPIYLRLKATTPPLQDGDQQRWVQPGQEAGDNKPIGLSAPAVKLLASLQDPFEQHLKK